MHQFDSHPLITIQSWYDHDLQNSSSRRWSPGTGMKNEKKWYRHRQSDTRQSEISSPTDSLISMQQRILLCETLQPEHIN